MPRARADTRVVAAGVRALGIDRAKPGLAVQIETVAIGQAGQREDLVLVIEVLDDARLAQALGDVLRRLVALEGIDQFQADQVVEAHFHRQGAAGRVAVTAQAGAVAYPGFQAFRVGGGDQSCLHGQSSVRSGARIITSRAAIASVFRRRRPDGR